MSRIAIIGATGRAGNELLQESLRRGHLVTALARHASTLEARSRLRSRDVDVNDAIAMQAALAGHDAVLSAVPFAKAPASAIIEPVKGAGVPRLLVVGGAASLLTGDQHRVFDLPGFPAEFKTEAAAGIAFLQALREEPTLDWTFLSPSASFEVGARTGTFRLGGDELLVGADGRSRISFADFAIALIDELERPQHSRQRFTVGY